VYMRLLTLQKEADKENAEGREQGCACVFPSMCVCVRVGMQDEMIVAPRCCIHSVCVCE
jgi:hypothetical protein